MLTYKGRKAKFTGNTANIHGLDYKEIVYTEGDLEWIRV